MKLEKESKLFFGLKVESALRDALSQVKDSERHYFEDPDGPYLMVVRHERERWIGKIVGPGLGVQEVEDSHRNILSILRRIAPEVRHAPSALKLFHIVEGGEEEEAKEGQEGQEGQEGTDQNAGATPSPSW